MAVINTCMVNTGQITYMENKAENINGRNSPVYKPLSALSPLLFVIVTEAISREFRVDG